MQAGASSVRKHFLEVGVGGPAAQELAQTESLPGKGITRVPPGQGKLAGSFPSQHPELQFLLPKPSPGAESGPSRPPRLLHWYWAFSDPFHDWLSASHEHRCVEGTPRSLGTLRTLSAQVRTCAHLGDFLSEGRVGEGKDCHARHRHTQCNTT